MQKDDVIYRQATIDAVNNAFDRETLLNGFVRSIAVRAIRDVPSAQKKGHWIDEGTNYLCSECHRGCWVNSNYCPWCGADMRGKQDD